MSGSALASAPGLSWDTDTDTGTDTGARVGRLRPSGMACRGQLLRVPAGRYDWLRFQVAGEVGTERVESAWLFFEHAVDREWFILPPGPRSTVALPVGRRATLIAVRLPETADLRVTDICAVRSTSTGGERA